VRVIGGSFKKTRIHGPGRGNRSLRPTHDRIRENVFNIIAPRVQGAQMLDLFAGCGCMGIEALSRGAAGAVFVENHPSGIRLIKKNIELLGLGEKSRVIRSDVAKFLKNAPAATGFDIVFMDPPYAEPELIEEALHLLGTGEMLGEGAVVVAEHRGRPGFEKTGKLELGEARRYSRITGISIWNYRKEETRTNGKSNLPGQL